MKSGYFVRPFILFGMASFALTACNDRFIEDIVDAPAEAEGSFDLRVEDVDRPDRVFEIETLDAPAGSDIVLIVTDASDTSPPCPEAMDPICLTISGEQERELRTVVDEDGEAWWYVPFSAAGPNGRLSVQAFTESDSPWVSRGMTLRVP